MKCLGLQIRESERVAIKGCEVPDRKYRSWNVGNRN